MAANAYITGLRVVVINASLTYVPVLQPSMRQGFSIYNNANTNMYLRFGDDVSTEWTTKIAPNHLYETMLPIYRGLLSAKWDGISGDAHVTEFH